MTNKTKYVYLPILAVGALAIALSAIKFLRHDKAAGGFQQQITAARGALNRFTKQYPELEQKVEPLRVAEPAKAAAELEAAMLPLLDDVIGALGKAIDAGESYLGGGGKEAPAKTQTAIRTDVDAWKRLIASYRTVRGTYAEEIRLLRAGPLSDADAGRLAQARVDAFQIQ